MTTATVQKVYVLLVCGLVLSAGAILILFHRGLHPKDVVDTLLGSAAVLATLGAFIVGRNSEPPTASAPTSRKTATHTLVSNDESQKPHDISIAHTQRIDHDQLAWTGWQHNIHALIRKARTRVIVGFLGTLVALAALSFSFYERRALALANDHLAQANAQALQAEAAYRAVIRLANQQSSVAPPNTHMVAAPQSPEPPRNLVPMPSGGALIIASVVGPDVPGVTRDQTREVPCYQPPPGYSLVSVKADWPGQDTNGGPPLCNTRPPTNCMASGVRCWNVYLQDGCLVSTDWLTWYKSQLKSRGLPPADPKAICAATDPIQ